MCSMLIMRKPELRQRCLFFILALSLALRIPVSLLLTLNIFHILDDVKNAEIRALYWKKERKVSLTDYKLKCFSSRI